MLVLRISFRVNLDVFEGNLNNPTKFGTSKSNLHHSGVTLIFEHSPSRPIKIEHVVIFSRPRENKLAR